MRAPPSSAPPGSSTSSTCGGRRARTSTGSASPSPSRSSRSSAAHGVSRTDRGRRGRRPPRPGHAAGARRRGDRRLPALRVPGPAPRARRRRRAAAPPSRTPTSSPRTRSRRSSREYERASTTTVDAYLGPVTARYLRAAGGELPRGRAARAARDAAPPAASSASPRRPTIRRSCSSRARREGSSARRCSRGSPGSRTRSRFDMGGTSTDVCLIAGGEAAPRRASGRWAGCRSGCRWSTSTRSAPAAARSSGVDAGGALRVGPRSAGADPGPACYGRGGGLPTVTDANLLLGRLPARARRAGSSLDRGRGRAGARRGSSPQAVVEVVNAEMLRALRVVSVERGHDPRDFALVAFGGAGPLHACALAEELGIATVLVPELAGVLSALGLAVGEERRDRVVSVRRCPLAEAGELPAAGEAELRYRGQSFELTVPLGPGPRRALPRRARRALRLRRPRARPSSSSPSARPRSRPGPELRARAACGAPRSPARRSSSSPARRCWVARRLARHAPTPTGRWCSSGERSSCR